jgi:hypothetical protein
MKFDHFVSLHSLKVIGMLLDLIFDVVQKLFNFFVL